ncbi:MAG: hypothetical protein GPOALKHO_000821 [Sodalis sp.]|nr:MAG: hypothetical protein GPOALKHO_000821 [Sodalis sp.]
MMIIKHSAGTPPVCMNTSGQLEKQPRFRPSINPIALPVHTGSSRIPSDAPVEQLPRAPLVVGYAIRHSRGGVVLVQGDNVRHRYQ